MRQTAGANPGASLVKGQLKKQKTPKKTANLKWPQIDTKKTQPPNLNVKQSHAVKRLQRCQTWNRHKQKKTCSYISAKYHFM